jgi:beta-carotene hydroxylase
VKSPLRRSSDRRSLFLVASTLGLMIFTFTLDFSNIDLLAYLTLLFVFVFAVIICTLINHNHRHHPIFKTNTQNQIFSYLLSWTIGAPSTRLHLIHHFNHHFHYPSHKDWSHFELNAKGSGIKRIFTYLYNATITMNKNRVQLRSSPYQRRALRNEKTILYLLATGALIINWKIFVFMIIPGWFIGLSMLLISNLLNHDQCDTNSEINHSRDFLNKIENWFFCNNGYHTAHHLKPHLHWEELPKLHDEKVKTYKNPIYSSDSFFSYLFQYCLRFKSK